MEKLKPWIVKFVDMHNAKLRMLVSLNWIGRETVDILSYKKKYNITIDSKLKITFFVYRPGLAKFKLGITLVK